MTTDQEIRRFLWPVAGKLPRLVCSGCLTPRPEAERLPQERSVDPVTGAVTLWLKSYWCPACRAKDAAQDE